MKNILSIALTNLNKYNCGTLDFVWLDFPCSDEELAEAFDKIEVSHDDKHYFHYGNESEEFFITDYESDFFSDVSEYANIEQLNEQAEQIADLDESEQNILSAILDYFKFDEAIQILNDGDFQYFPSCNDMSDVAFEVVNESGWLEKIPEHLRNYFDYEAFGRDLAIESTFIGTDYGYIEILR